MNTYISGCYPYLQMLREDQTHGHVFSVYGYDSAWRA